MDSDFYRRRARKQLLAIAALIVGGIVLYRYFSPAFSLEKLSGVRNSAERFAAVQIEKRISTPPPLRKTKSEIPSAPRSVLSGPGIIANTNLQRSENGGLAAFAENGALDGIAKARLADMFQKQYFAHIAPDGGSAETAAKTVGYDYLALGENLALGNYGGDKGVVAAWMQSPGHRANILNNRYTEIGAAAAKGMFEGENTWIAVQIFGKPLSDCPSPNAELKAAIDGAENQLSQTDAEIQAGKARLDAMEPRYGSAYNQAVGDYNRLAEQYNVLLEQTKSQIAAYNGQVEAFNTCAAP